LRKKCDKTVIKNRHLRTLASSFWDAGTFSGTTVVGKMIKLGLGVLFKCGPSEVRKAADGIIVGLLSAANGLSFLLGGVRKDGILDTEGRALNDGSEEGEREGFLEGLSVIVGSVLCDGSVDRFGKTDGSIDDSDETDGLRLDDVFVEGA